MTNNTTISVHNPFGQPNNVLRRSTLALFSSLERSRLRYLSTTTSLFKEGEISFTFSPKICSMNTPTQSVKFNCTDVALCRHAAARAGLNSSVDEKLRTRQPRDEYVQRDPPGRFAWFCCMIFLLQFMLLPRTSTLDNKFTKFSKKRRYWIMTVNKNFTQPF